MTMLLFINYKSHKHLIVAERGVAIHWLNGRYKDNKSFFWMNATFPSLCSPHIVLSYSLTEPLTLAYSIREPMGGKEEEYKKLNEE